MLSIYVFSLVLGGGLLLLSLFGDAVGDGLDGDLGVDIDLDADLDVDLDTDVDTGPGLAPKLFSLRMFTYMLFGFGAVGEVLSWVGFDPAGITTIGLSAMGAVAAGVMVQTVFRYLDATDSGAHPGEGSLVGLAGRVTIPITAASPGSIVVHRGDRRLTLRALPYEGESDPGGWHSVVIVEMDRGVARVTPIKDEYSVENDSTY
ncbi:MAG: hypothetical protein OEZ65_00155 [Gemmatimonadota bacterium]|nr:hypothetical protein [Gemmatimonadota bacterium]MDH5757964.1 hypothetical protein [Gemmatimonadota bacterium]